MCENQGERLMFSTFLSSWTPRWKILQGKGVVGEGRCSNQEGPRGLQGRVTQGSPWPLAGLAAHSGQCTHRLPRERR